MDHISSSQINLYLLCGLKYKYQYIDQLPKPFKSSALAFGSAFHSALSWLHNQLIHNGSVTPEMLYKIFDVDWYVQKVEREIKYKTGEKELSLTLLGKELLTLYLNEPHKKLKGSEFHFVVPLIHPVTRENLGINLEGYFDLIEADDTIVEFKTTAQTMSQDDVDNHIQLTAYGYAYGMLMHKPAKGFKIVNFVKKKKPTMEIIETQRNGDYYDGFFFLVKETLRGIQSSTFIPHVGYWCKDCEYMSHCPMWKHHVEVKQIELKSETIPA